MSRVSETIDTLKELADKQEKCTLPKWIPVSERLPEKPGRYLVTNSAWGAFMVDWNIWVNGDWLYPNGKPIAWMDMPEPYEGFNERSEL